MIEKYCVSLEIAKKLKEAGWDKKTNFIYAVDNLWYTTNMNGIAKNGACLSHENLVLLDDKFSAPITEEILEELPIFLLTGSQPLQKQDINSLFMMKHYYYDYKKRIRENLNSELFYTDEWEVGYRNYYEYNQISKVLADALALLWVKLKEHNLI
jgi:hypothetical protein